MSSRAVTRHSPLSDVYWVSFLQAEKLQPPHQTPISMILPHCSFSPLHLMQLSSRFLSCCCGCCCFVFPIEKSPVLALASEFQTTSNLGVPWGVPSFFPLPPFSQSCKPPASAFTIHTALLTGQLQHQGTRVFEKFSSLAHFSRSLPKALLTHSSQGRGWETTMCCLW